MVASVGKLVMNVTWAFLRCRETTQFPSYDNDGNLLQRIDGNEVITNYLYTDPESLLTDIQYPASTSLNVQFTYDSYGAALR